MLFKRFLSRLFIFSSVSFFVLGDAVIQRYPLFSLRATKMRKGITMFTFDDFMNAVTPPEPYQPGAELWNDPHISKMMLQAHLSQDSDAASYRQEKIAAICAYLIGAMRLQYDCSIADLGCGPGLYCSQLAQQGYRMTGIDRSENSIRYAKNHDGDSNYILDSYLNPFGENQFEAALMVSQDYGVLSPLSRKILLGNIFHALKPNGCFAFDVCSMAAFENRKDTDTSKWYASDSGFWRPHKHLVLKKTILYPDISALCDLVTVLDSGGIEAYRIYQSFFSPKSIRSELEENGFRVELIRSNLYGEPYSAASLEIGVLCRKACS